MALLECPFLLLVLGPVLRQRVASWRALEDAAPTLDERRSHGFEKDSLRCGLNHGLGPVLNVELFAQAKWDDDLPLRRKPYGFELLSCTHMLEYDILYKVRQYKNSRIIAWWEEFCSLAGCPTHSRTLRMSGLSTSAKPRTIYPQSHTPLAPHPGSVKNRRSRM